MTGAAFFVQSIALHSQTGGAAHLKGRSVSSIALSTSLFITFGLSPAVSDATATTVPSVSAAGTSNTSVLFNVYENGTNYGQNVYVVGSIPQLGNWNPSNAVGPFSGQQYPLWTDTLGLPPGTAFQYKYLVKPGFGGQSVTWGTGPNFFYQVPTQGTATVTNSFNNTAGTAPPGPSITTSTLPKAAVGQSYTETLQAFDDGLQPYTWTVAGGALPAGLSLSADGTISGTATAVAADTFTVQVTDAGQGAATKALTLDVYQPPSALSIPAQTLTPATVGVPYTASLTASGGTAPYSWRTVPGSVYSQLPSGLALASDGTLSGTPTTVSQSFIAVEATDASGQTAATDLPFTVNPASIQVSPTSVQAGYNGATLQIAGTGTDFAAGKTTVVLSSSVNGSIDLTPDTTVKSPASLVVSLPTGTAGIGSGSYTLSVATGSSAQQAPFTVAPYTAASTVQWDGVYTSQSTPYLSNPNPAPGSSLTVGFRAYSGNLTHAVLNYYDTAQNKGFSVPMKPSKTWGPYELWTATIPASDGGTLWYRFDLYDHQSFACLTGSGLQTTDTTNGNFPAPVGSFSLSALQVNQGATVTASNPFGNFSSGATTIQFLNNANQTLATVPGLNASFGSVQFTVPGTLASGLYTVAVTTQAKDADGVVNAQLSESTLLAVGSGNYWFDALKHDSFHSFYRSPFGAVTAGTPITLRLRGPVGLSGATLRVWNAGGNTGETDFAMHPVTLPPATIAADTGNHPAHYSWWQATIPGSDVSQLGAMWYQFKVVYQGQTFYYDDNAQQLEGVGQPSASASGPSYQISVYDPTFQTPNWLKHAVIYEIFPDRFFNGNIANDENPATQQGIGTLPNGSQGLVPIQFHNHWGSLPYDPAITANPQSPNYKKELSLRGNGQWNIDFFGGDLRGIIYKLDYLKSLGVNTLYMTPIFQSESNHKYDTGNFYQIDPGFGSMQTWLNLVKAAHTLHMHVILDVAFEDTGSNSAYFNRFGNYASTGAWQQYQNPSVKSLYYNWYQWTGNPANPYNSWWGYNTLPLTNTNSHSYQNFVYGGSNSVAKYWINQGASGWRLDSADNGNFNVGWWSAFRKAVKSVDPNAAIIGEIWNNATNDNGTNWLTGQTFDSVMNYQFRNAVIDFFRGTYNDGNAQHTAVGASGFNQRLMRLYSEYPLPSFYAMMNLVDSQDTMRILTVLENAPSPTGMSAFAQATWQPTPAEKALGVARLKLVSDFQFGFPGNPTIWYGDEAGVTGYKDPLNRKTYPWGHANETLLNHYRKLGMIRDGNPVLQTGQFKPLYANGGVYAFARTITQGRDVFNQPAANASAVVALNNQNQVASLSIPVKGTVADGTQMLNELDNQWFTVQQGHIQITLQPYQGAILVSQPSSPVAYMQNAGGQSYLAWTPMNGATGYRIWMKRSDGQWKLMGERISPTLSEANVTRWRQSAAIQLEVQALYGSKDGKGDQGRQQAGGSSQNSSHGQVAPFLSGTVTIPAANLKMGSVAVKAKKSGVSLSWAGVPFASQYIVYEKAADGSYQRIAILSASGERHKYKLRWTQPGTGVFRVAAANEDSISVSPDATVGT